MSRLRAISLAIVIVLAGLSTTATAAAPTFDDIATSPFRADIEWIAARGITGGCDTRRYCPNGVVTRGQMASFLARMFDLPPATRDYFSDDNASMHQSAINRLAQSGITGGCDAGRFCPDAQLNRAQMASLLARVIGLSEGSGTNYFHDDNGSAHEGNINRIARAGISTGCGGGRYCPASSVTRGEMAAFLHRVVKPIQPPKPSTGAPAPAAPVNGTGAGYGAATVGGAGGAVLRVTNLNDAGPGSLRAALEASGRRTVTFAVSGTVTLNDDIKIRHPHLTVAGETAPAPGISVRNGSIVVTAGEVILRHLRLRPGDATKAPSDTDALTLNGVRGPVTNVVVDHMTMLWGPDIGGLAILGDVTNVTVSNSIMGEGLRLSRHAEGVDAEGGHSMAANLTQLEAGSPWPRRITMWRNLFTTSDARMPRFQGAECVDLVNNVIYNWGQDAAHGNPRSVNVVNNWYRSGPETDRFLLWRPQTSNVAPNLYPSAVYEAGNVSDGFTGSRGEGSVYAGSARCGGLSVAATTARAAYDTVLAGAGAVSPRRDAVDARVITNVRNRTGAFFNGTGHPTPNPYWP